ncbi:MAG: competence/damage-inducible protein A [Flavobacteriales bacterium]|nr:competence/damage-inducible protein A [Flavobacteriales bacterium]|tara:strand:+ start:8480 stop:9718 length:1239 start_codon:yes stop_codon:yes gene_type:complete
MNAIVISIGDELLIGQTINTNAGWMGAGLNRNGVELREVLTICDDELAIKEALTYAQSKASLVLITGGLGPTKDDITKKIFADYFNTPLIENKKALVNVEDFFKRYNLEMLSVNKRQALVPKGCEMLLNKVGTAPGMWMEQRGVVFVSMPGVPSEMKYLMENEVFPRIKKRFELPAIIHQTIMTQGIGESYIAKEISDIEDSLPKHIKLAYLPSPGIVKLRLSGRGKDELSLIKEIDILFNKIESRIEKHVFSKNEAQLQEILNQLLIEKKLTLSTAESLTSGALASRITSVPGASAYFKGSIVAYSNSVKVRQLGVFEEILKLKGAVSKEVVEQMAIGAQKLFATDYALSTSGIAGPDGGTDQKPVGTVWIGIAGPKGVFSEQFQMGKGRGRVVEKTIFSALSRLLQLINQ